MYISYSYFLTTPIAFHIGNHILKKKKQYFKAISLTNKDAIAIEIETDKSQLQKNGKHCELLR